MATDAINVTFHNESAARGNYYRSIGGRACQSWQVCVVSVIVRCYRCKSPHGRLWWIWLKPERRERSLSIENTACVAEVSGAWRRLLSGSWFRWLRPMKYPIPKSKRSRRFYERLRHSRKRGQSGGRRGRVHNVLRKWCGRDILGTVRGSRRLAHTKES